MLQNIFYRKPFSFAFNAIAILMFIFISCSDEQEPAVKPQNKLKARAGVDKTVLLNTEVLLDGSASINESGEKFDYKWELKYKPSGSSVAISNGSSAQSTFTPDKTGVYQIALTISDGNFSDTDEVHVTVTKTDDPEEPITVLISENIIEERILKDIFTDPATPDYIVTQDIQVQAALTLEPGVIIEFEQDRSLQMMLGGSLIASGTSSQPVIFTGTQKQKGFWQGLLFATNSDHNNLHYTIIEYAGSSEFPESPRTAISVPGDAISGSVLRIANSTVRYSGGRGLYVGGMSYLAEFSQMVFADNEESAIYGSPKNVSLVEPNTIFNDNGFDGIETGGTLFESLPVSWNPLVNGAYLLSSDLTIASSLNIVDGAVFKIANNVLVTISPEGSLVASGTADSNIVFEGVSTIASKAWRGILFKSGHENIINHAVIINAGYSEMPGMTGVRASVAVAADSKLTIKNSWFQKSEGWGIALEKSSYYNEDIHTGNDFTQTVLGSVKFPEQLQSTDIAGEWVDYFSYAANRFTINENFYNRSTGVWFEGAEHPWVMLPQTGFGLKIDASGNYIWTMATQHSPMTECFTYSAEYFTGHITADGAMLNFVESSWRDKYVNSCTPSENVDIDVQPGQMQLPYQITKEYNVLTGEAYYVLAITSGNETFKLYKK